MRDDDGDVGPEEVHEDVDDVQVDGEGCEDVLLGGDRVLVVPSNHHLRKIMLTIDGSPKIMKDLQISKWEEIS